MPRRHFLPTAFLATVLCVGVRAVPAASAAEDQVNVAAVRFHALPPPDGSAEDWFEMEVELDARPAPGRPGRITHRFRIDAYLASEAPGPAGSGRRWAFYRATAEVAGLSPGRAHVRFYLPPEIVKRDGVAGVPKYWAVDLNGDGVAPPELLNRIAPALENAETRRGFQEKIALDGAANDGLLRPQYLTPFAGAYPRSTPSFVRREAWR
jgi:hypothetical protein